MNMRTLFIYLFLMITVVCNAQTNVSINQLNGTSWIMTSPPDEDIIEKASFNNCSYTSSTEYILIKGKAVSRFKYYLSPTVPAAFNFSKVGTKTSGKYMIGYNSKMKEIFYYEIIRFDSKKMVLLRKGKPFSIGGAEDLYMTYQRIK